MSKCVLSSNWRWSFVWCTSECVITSLAISMFFFKVRGARSPWLPVSMPMISILCFYEIILRPVIMLSIYSHSISSISLSFSHLFSLSLPPLSPFLSVLFIFLDYSCSLQLMQGRWKRSSQSGHGRTTFWPAS